MTKKITLDVVKQIYPLAKNVHKGRLNIKDAQDKLVRDVEMNPSSAGGYVRVFLRMMKGERYTRTINQDATRHFLKMIHADFGQQALCEALSSVKHHTKYYKSRRSGGLPAIERIYNDFYKKYIA